MSKRANRARKALASRVSPLAANQQKQDLVAGNAVVATKSVTDLERTYAAAIPISTEWTAKDYEESYLAGASYQRKIFFGYAGALLATTITTDRIRTALFSNEFFVATFFICIAAAVSIQLIVASLNRNANWLIMMQMMNNIPPKDWTPLTKWADRWTKQIWMENTLDCLTCILLFISTITFFWAIRESELEKKVPSDDWKLVIECKSTEPECMQLSICRGSLTTSVRENCWRTTSCG